MGAQWQSPDHRAAAIHTDHAEFVEVEHQVAIIRQNCAVDLGAGFALRSARFGQVRGVWPHLEPVYVPAVNSRSVRVDYASQQFIRVIHAEDQGQPGRDAAPVVHDRSVRWPIGRYVPPGPRDTGRLADGTQSRLSLPDQRGHLGIGEQAFRCRKNPIGPDHAEDRDHKQ